MPGFTPTYAGQRLDLAYLYADGADKPIAELALTAKRIGAYGAVVYTSSLRTLVPLLEGTDIRTSAVVSFPDGRAGWQEIEAAARQAKEDGAYGCDPVVNLAAVAQRNWSEISNMCQTMMLNLKETKLICQIPYLWQYDREAIPAIIDRMPVMSVGTIKDWTGKQTFSVPVDLSLAERLKYTEWIANYIVRNNVRFKGELIRIKIAGGVDGTNARQFVDAGADLLGASAHKADAIIASLL